MATKNRGLGKGLDAIFAENTVETGGAVTIRLSEIEPNRNQPRKEFDEASLSELADALETLSEEERRRAKRNTASSPANAGGAPAGWPGFPRSRR